MSHTEYDYFHVQKNDIVYFNFKMMNGLLLRHGKLYYSMHIA